MALLKAACEAYYASVSDDEVAEVPAPAPPPGAGAGGGASLLSQGLSCAAPACAAGVVEDDEQDDEEDDERADGGKAVEAGSLFAARVNKIRKGTEKATADWKHASAPW